MSLCGLVYRLRTSLGCEGARTTFACPIPRRGIGWWQGYLQAVVSKSYGARYIELGITLLKLNS